MWATIGSLFEVALGGTPSRKKSEYWDGEIPWVSSGEVAFGRIKTTREKITSEGLANSNAKLHPSGTVLLAMIGEGKTRGQAAILDVVASTNQNVASILCARTAIPPEWVFWCLYYQYQNTREGGSGGAQPALNAARVKELVIPLAPLLEQRRIVARIEALFAQADAVERAVAIARQRADKIDQAILSRAFRGEL
jgi:type I restriction enzyme S subunit